MASMIESLLKTPEQVRQEQLAKLQQQGLQQAQLMTAGQTPFANWGAGQIARMPEAMDRAARMGGQAAGSLAQAAGAAPETVGMLRGIGVSPEERRAQEMQQKMAGAKGDYHGLMALGQELLQSGNAQDAYAVLQLAKEIEPEATDPVNNMDTNDMKNIAAIGANQFQCDVRKDPQCFLKAKEEYINLKRADVAQQKMEVFGYEGLVKRTDEARAAAKTLETIDASLKTLDSGEVNVGIFPNTRQGADKLVGQIFGISDATEQAARTELLMGQVNRLATDLLQTGAFGTGTGISKADLEAAQRISGASNTLTPEGMVQILQYQAKLNRAVIKRHNDRIKRYSPEFYARTPEGEMEQFYVSVPDVHQMKNVGVKPKAETVPYYDKNTDMMFNIPKGAVFGNNGTVYEFEGKYYNLDGTEIK